MIEKCGEWWFESKPIGEADRSFDIAYWQAQGPEAIFRAAEELVRTAHVIKGGSLDELRLSRHPVVIEPIRR